MRGSWRALLLHLRRVDLGGVGIPLHAAEFFATGVGGLADGDGVDRALLGVDGKAETGSSWLRAPRLVPV